MLTILASCCPAIHTVNFEGCDCVTSEWIKTLCQLTVGYGNSLYLDNSQLWCITEQEVGMQCVARFKEFIFPSPCIFLGVYLTTIFKQLAVISEGNMLIV